MDHISPQVDIYNNMVAGAFPFAEGIDPAQSVRMLAQEVLHASDVHIRYAVEDSHVFYLACNSRSLASSPNFTTALAAGLPDHPQHRGDGCYTLTLPPNHAATVVRRGNTLKLFSNFAEAVLETCREEDLPQIELNDSAAEPLQSQSWVYRKMSNRVANITSFASLSVLGLCVLVILGSNAVSGYLSKSHAIDLADTASKANAIIETTPFTQPLAEQLNRVQSLSYAAVNAGGWIDGYHYKTNAGERYVVSLPSWVTQETVKNIGEGAKTEAQPGGNLIWVIKKDALGTAVKNRGPAPIANVPPPPSAAPAAVKVAAKD